MNSTKKKTPKKRRRPGDKPKITEDALSTFIGKHFSEICMIVDRIAMSNMKRIEIFDQLSEKEREILLLGIRHGISASVAAMNELFVIDENFDAENVRFFIKKLDQ